VNVAHVIEAMHTGGAESLVLEHVRLAGPGVRTTVIALNRGGPALEQARALGADVHVVKRPGRHPVVHRLLAGGDVARVLRERRIDVVNGHNPTGALYGLLGAALAGVPVMVRTEHSLDYPGRHSRIYPLLERLSTAFTRRVVCVCRAVLDSHVRRLPWASRRFVTVANGIASAPHTRPREETRAALGLSAGDTLVLTVGSLTRQKAQHVLLEGFARAAGSRPHARLMLAGEGPLRGALEARIAALGLGARVTLLGPRGDVADLMEACDVFALTSVREGLSVTLLEAMRAARAAVVTDIGGCAEAVADGVTGRVVPVGDVDALGEAFGALLDDAPRRAAMGRAARERWAERFTAERMVRETEALYRAALAEAGRATDDGAGGRDAAARA
jgi:glycosyltransferase involved in cell wall biosynthesis